MTESVIIDGQGAIVQGAPRWVTVDGLTNIADQCPGRIPGAVIVSQAPGFLRVESGATVEIRNMEFRQLSALVHLRDNSNLILHNSRLREIIDWFRFCDRPAIWGLENANVTVSDSVFTLVQNAGGVVGSPVGTLIWEPAAISDLDSGTLNVTNTIFESGKAAIQWSGTANIVSSQFRGSGWINTPGGSANIVNSLFVSDIGFDDFARIYASDNAVVDIQASTFYASVLACDRACLADTGALIANAGATINVRESAVGVGLPADIGNLLRTNGGGGITADVFTWMQSVQSQDSATLQSFTGQPGLLTDPPGLPNTLVPVIPGSVTPLLGSAPMPGVLIDAIPDAAAGGSNELRNPIDNAPIALDVFGNPRVDGNNTRTIGAIQLTLAPHLVVTSVGRRQVELSWNRPKDPDPATPVTGYAVLYQPVDGSIPERRVDLAGPDTLTATISGLIPGTAYEFTVVGVNASGDGPPSNAVQARTTGSAVLAVPSLSPAMLAMLALCLLLLAWRSTRTVP